MPTVTFRSARGNGTRYTSSGIIVPDLPIALSMAAVSRPDGLAGGVCAASVQKRTNAMDEAEIMVRMIPTLKVKEKREKLKVLRRRSR